MAFKIIEESDRMTVESINVLIYGEPGIGKTSVSQTADETMLLDFDGGAHRSVGRKTVVKMESWQDAHELLQSGLIKERGVKTLIIDTAGTMLDDYMADAVIKDNGKNGKQGGGLSLQGYGALKQQFNSFMSELRMLNIDVIFICHDQKEARGEQSIFIPKVTGGSYDILLGKCDMVGYMQSRNNKRTIDFNPTDEHRGKNTAAFPIMEIPLASDPAYANFMADLIKGVKDKISAMSEQQKEALKKLEELRADIQAIDNVEDIIAFQQRLDSMDTPIQVQLRPTYDIRFIALWEAHMSSLKEVKSFQETAAMIKIIGGNAFKHVKKLRELFAKRMDAIGVIYDKDSGSFIPPLEKTSTNEQSDKGESKQQTMEI